MKNSRIIPALLAIGLCCWLGASTKSRFMLSVDGSLQYLYPANTPYILSAPTLQEAQRRLETINGRALTLSELLTLIKARAAALEANTQETTP